MKKVIIIAGLLVSSLSIGQNNSTIAVTNPNIHGLYATPEIGAKLIRLELANLDKYNVYDEFDMKEVFAKDTTYEYDCISTSCLTNIGNDLGVDYTISGSFDSFGNKIVISLKIVDVKNQKVYMTGSKEFDDQEAELQRMTSILLREMHGLPVEKELKERLEFNNEVITSNNVGKINNSGPRVGFAYMTGTYNEFATRPENQGGLDIFPGISMFGYQIEAQYVGTENFSALVEGLVNIGGLEQGVFMPSVSLLNGFRFGKGGWEFAFGPSFGIKKVSDGFFDTHGLIGDEGDYVSERDWNSLRSEDSVFLAYSSPEELHSDYEFKEHGDTRGVAKFNTTFIVAAGRTFRAGALNIPVNVFYSSRKGGGMVGLSVGFNVMNKKQPINDSRKNK